MLQQTQVARVIPKYKAWLNKFPTIESLARAKTADVLRLWSGLGYNRRALYLKKTATTITSVYKGKWPEDITELKKLPGIGEYTARAIACFAFGEQVAVVDTNVRKVILSQYPTPNVKYQMSNKDLQAVADLLLPKDKAYEWNQALMDYAAAVLKSDKIPVPKQSRFQGSRRYYRGKLLRILLTSGMQRIEDIGVLLKEDFSDSDAVWLEGLISELEREGFIKRENTMLALA